MAIPNNTLTAEPIPAPYAGATREPLIGQLYDKQDGPVSEQDPSLGNSYQYWEAWLQDGAVYYQAENQNEPTKLLDHEVTTISFCFNQNGDMYYTWTDLEGDCWFTYFNSDISNMDTMQLPTGSRTPYLTLDDKRSVNSSGSDVLLFYLNSSGALVERIQREKFETEHILDNGPFITLEKAGMSTGLRMQFQLLRSTAP